jgi:hypothetical protein
MAGQRLPHALLATPVFVEWRRVEVADPQIPRRHHGLGRIDHGHRTVQVADLRAPEPENGGRHARATQASGLGGSHAPRVPQILHDAG